MSDIRQETIDTYNKSARELAQYFRGIGSRVADIDAAFKAAGNPKEASVIEIGCGDGRDAKEIVKRTSNYIGFDISSQLIELAKQLVPKADFRVGDARTFEYPSNIDIVFAFASLLHLNQAEIKEVFKNINGKLRQGGIFYVSLKYSDKYEERVKEDKYGRRQFFFYNPDLIKQLAGSSYQTVHEDRKTIGNTEWMEIILRRN